MLILIGVSNTAPLRYLLEFAFDLRHFRYSNASGTYTRTHMNSNDIVVIDSNFKRFLAQQQNIAPEDTILYRLYWRNPFAFWRYWSYMHEKYDYPYKSWSEIRARRALNRKHHSKSYFQQF